MSVAALEHPFWWRVFERHDTPFSAGEVATVMSVCVVETDNNSTSPDLDVSALLTLKNGHGASIRAHYSHRERAITIVKWSITTYPLPVADAA